MNINTSVIGMSKKDWDKKETAVGVIVLLGGVAFTVTSFCIYYLVDPPNTAGLAIICVADFLYTLFVTCIGSKYVFEWKKWYLKGPLMSVGYVAAFIVVGILFLSYCGSFEYAISNIVGIVFYAIFTAPCIFIVVPLFFLLLSYG